MWACAQRKEEVIDTIQVESVKKKSWRYLLWACAQRKEEVIDTIQVESVKKKSWRYLLWGCAQLSWAHEDHISHHATCSALPNLEPPFRRILGCREEENRFFTWINSHHLRFFLMNGPYFTNLSLVANNKNFSVHR